MATLIERYLHVFRTAHLIEEALWADGIAPEAISVDVLAEYVAKAFGVEITIEDIPELMLKNEIVLGHVERYGDRGRNAQIYLVVSDEDVPMKRYVGAKEISQIALDAASDFDTDGEDTLSRMVTQPPQSEEREHTAYVSEKRAEVLSWELLYPFELRRDDLAKLEASCGDDLDKIAAATVEIADRRLVPVHIVRRVLSKPWMDWTLSYWRAIAAERERVQAMRTAGEAAGGSRAV